MVKKKGKSGRITLKQKYKIKRKVTDHHRKQRKEAKKTPQLAKRKPKDPGIPNSLPFKQEVLAELAHAKAREEERRLQAKEKRRAELMKRRGLTPEGQTMEGLVSNAEESQETFNKAEEAKKTVDEFVDEDKHARYGQSSRRAYFRELKKVVEKADVVLEVLDARDPLGSRAESVEDAVLSKAGKKLVLVLNKVDLVPKSVVTKWLKYLRRSFPTIAFKASTQDNSSTIKQTKGSADKAGEGMLNLSGAVGTEALMSVLKNYCRNLDIKTATTVGVIGYPNVGKSSLINSLMRCRTVGVSATPGFTKVMQEIRLDKTVKLLDCPGIVFDDSDAGATLLRNCVDAEAMEDPTPAVAAMLKRCAPEQLMQVYSIPRFDPDDTFSFLALVARKMNKLRRGGVPDRMQAAKAVLRDWNIGRVPFYTLPPEDPAGGGGGVEGAKATEAVLLDGFSKEFDVEAEDAQVLEGLPEQDPMDFVAVKPGRVAKGCWNDGGDAHDGADAMDEEGDEDDEEEVDHDANGEDEAPMSSTSKRSRVSPTQKTSSLSSDGEESACEDDEAGTSGASVTSGSAAGVSSAKAALDAMLATERAINPQVNRSLKKTRKAEKKKQRRAAARASMSPPPSAAAAGTDEVGGEYEFKRDFYDAGNGDGVGDLSGDDDL